ncbi:DUF2058 domain-containing protein [Amnimonas aquatica]|uniref:DUF2058 domain-containing protein n=1 Tax=Amnimonas aquatica TaxID=2094561 RepID=A0A2P6ASD1_9GAMM|nr:DUF2058 domain-containing protein [Amnimonas aquatica]PQA42492.1 DUF2058 domain-containing protein [Amnimonas aquatica]
MASLKDQLLKAGLADQKRARQADHARRQAAKGRSDGESAAELAQRARSEQAEKDREANRQLQQAQAEKALAAQVRQLIEQHRIGRAGGEQSWQFVDGRKVKKLMVTGAQHDQLVRGQVAVVRLAGGPAGDAYELVPAVVAERIRQRDAGVIVQLNERRAEDKAEDDPYADYPIPDDLMW